MASLKQRIGALLLVLLLWPVSLLALLLVPLLVALLPLPRAWQCVTGLDFMGNAIVFGGSPYETISAHAWYSRASWWGRALCAALDLVQSGHCQQAAWRESAVKRVLQEPTQ